MDSKGDETPDYSSIRPDSTTGTPLRPNVSSYPEEADNCNSSSEGEEIEESFHNPEPPAALLESSKELFTADNIGDTVYSKHWLFTTLMNLIQAVENHASAKENDEDVLIELDEGLQDELCKLWDMSMNEAVVSFLLEFQVSEILTGVLERSKVPRATEICLGILGNMCCNAEAARIISSNEKLRGLILMHLNESDTPTLVETMRCLHTCVSNSAVQRIWCDAIKNEPTIYVNSRFILESSTNTDLLKNASQFIDEVMDVDEKICETWSTRELILAVLEAINQFGTGHGNDLNCLFHILQQLSTNENGGAALVNEAEAVSKLLLHHLVEACDDEIVGVLGRESFFASLFSVLNTILTGCDTGKALVQNDFQLMRCLLKAFDVIYPTVNKDQERDQSRRYRRRRTTSSGHDSPGRKENGRTKSEVNGASTPPSEKSEYDQEEQRQEEYNETMLGVLYEIMRSLLSDIIVVISSEGTAESTVTSSEETVSQSTSIDKSETPSDESYAKPDSSVESTEQQLRGAANSDVSGQMDNSGLNNNAVSETLSYLNDHCSRERLYFMTWSLREKSGDDTAASVNHFELLRKAAKDSNLERLARVMVDAEDFL